MYHFILMGYWEMLLSILFGTWLVTTRKFLIFFADKSLHPRLAFSLFCFLSASSHDSLKQTTTVYSEASPVMRLIALCALIWEFVECQLSRLGVPGRADGNPWIHLSFEAVLRRFILWNFCFQNCHLYIHKLYSFEVIFLLSQINLRHCRFWKSLFVTMSGYRT